MGETGDAAEDVTMVEESSNAAGKGNNTGVTLEDLLARYAKPGSVLTKPSTTAHTKPKAADTLFRTSGERTLSEGSSDGGTKPPYVRKPLQALADHARVTPVSARTPIIPSTDTPTAVEKPKVPCEDANKAVTATPSIQKVRSLTGRLPNPNLPRPRFTPRRPGAKIDDSQYKFFHKGTQCILLPHNDENTPPQKDISEELQRLRSAHAEELARKEAENKKLKEEIDYCMSQVRKLQTESTIKSQVNQDTSVSMGKTLPIGDRQYDVFMKPIGKGASCMVYRGIDKETDEMVAIKVVSLAKLNPADQEEMRKEVELLKSLKDEECIINLYDYEYRMDKGRLSLVLEYGELDLNSYLQHCAPLRRSQTRERYYEVCLLWHQMLRAVQSIHRNNVVHKDLKPQNFLKVKGKLKLIDFGISQKMQGEGTSMIVANPAGTPNYIAPELMSGSFGATESNRISYRSDVYSLGCILYKMCYGVTPYEHINKMQMKYMAIVSREPVQIPTDLPFPDLREILRRCLQKDRQDRPTVEELLAG